MGEQICFPIHLASRLLVTAYRPLLNEIGLTYPQYLVMLALWEADGVSMGAIGKRLHLDAGTLTPLVKRLAQLGLIKRKRSRTDDRIVETRLTIRGEALRDRATAIPERISRAIALEPSEAVALKACVERLTGTLIRADAEPCVSAKTEAPLMAGTEGGGSDVVGMRENW